MCRPCISSRLVSSPVALARLWRVLSLSTGYCTEWCLCLCLAAYTRVREQSVCSSVNEVACHAIPDDRPLQDGDLVSFDVSVFLKVGIVVSTQ